MISMFVTLLFSGMVMYGQSTTSSVKVYGNCGMCKSRIEKAAKSVEGVSAADWNKETKILEVSFDGSKTTTKMIEKAVAGAGHDTKDLTADKKDYDKLPDCCKYERKPEKK